MTTNLWTIHHARLGYGGTGHSVGKAGIISHISPKKSSS